jgi:hypothetical protein
MKNKMEAESGLLITGYINNSNFLRQTTVDDVMNADSLIKEVSKITSVPIVYVSALESILNKLPNDISGEKFEINLSLRSDWL